MKIELRKIVEYEVMYLEVLAGVRYWEDAEVDGVEDCEGTLIPCRLNNYLNPVTKRTEDFWNPIIDIVTGQIINWENGVTANIHYKVCDNGVYRLLDLTGPVVTIDGYVPKCMCPLEEGYGDYIIMNVNEDGFIEGWDPTFEEFEN
jgi:hypothetical protein